MIEDFKMDKKYRSSGYILRVSSLVLTCTGILYIALHRHVTLSRKTKLSALPTIVEHEKVLSLRYDFQKLRRNLTLLSNKMTGLFTFLKQNGLDLSEMADASDFARMNTNSPTSQSTSLLTLFTTLKWSGENEAVFNNTMLNWASFRPVVNPVLFTDDAVSKERARMYGWTVMNLTKTSRSGLPVLKHMYLSAMKSYHSQYYCFANSDILFDGGLIKSLLNIHYHTISSPLKHVFITGKRFNVVNVTKNDVSKRQDIKNLVNTRGELFSTSAEDYFITDKFYPWESIPEVVIASPAYDNWLVMNARANSHFVVDATKTITIVHQSVDENNHRSHARDTAAYNANLLKDQYKINVPYHKGFIDCIERFTDIFEDNFVIRHRTVDAFCN